MGMFDYMHVNLTLLPLAEEERNRLIGNEGFQPKSLNRDLTDYYITEDGYLEMTPGPDFSDEDWIINPLNERFRISDANGTINFYTSVRDETYAYFEFEALFLNGHLQSIRYLGNNVRTERIQTCFWETKTLLEPPV